MSPAATFRGSVVVLLAALVSVPTTAATPHMLQLEIEETRSHGNRVFAR